MTIMNRGRTSSGLTSDGNASTTSSDNSGPNTKNDSSSSISSLASGGGGGGGGTTTSTTPTSTSTSGRLGNKLGINKLKNRMKLKRISGIKNIEIRNSFDNISIAEETIFSEVDGVAPSRPYYMHGQEEGDNDDNTMDEGKQQGNDGAYNDADEDNHVEFVEQVENELPRPDLDLGGEVLNKSDDGGHRKVGSSLQECNDRIMNASTNEGYDDSEQGFHQDEMQRCDESERGLHQDEMQLQLQLPKNGESSSDQTYLAKKSSDDEMILPTTLPDVEYYFRQEVPPAIVNSSPVKLTTTGAPHFTILDISMEDSDMDVYENEDEHNSDYDDDIDIDDNVDGIDCMKNENLYPHFHEQQIQPDRKQPQSSFFEPSTQPEMAFGVKHFTHDASIDVLPEDLDDNIRSGKDDTAIGINEDSHRPRRSPRESCDDVRIKHSKLNHPSSTKSSLSCMRHQASNVSNSSSTFHQEYNVDHSCSTPLERLTRDIGNTLRQWHVHQGCDWHVPLDWAEQMEDLENDLEEEEEDEDEDNDEMNSDKISDVGDGENETQMSQDVDMSIMSDVSPVTTTTCMSMDLCMNGFRNRTRTINLWMGDENAKIPSGISLQTKSPSKLRPQPPPPTKSETKPPLLPLKERKAIPAVKKISRERNHRGARCIRSKKIQFHTIGFSPESRDDSVSGNRRRYCIPLVLKLWDAPQFPTNGVKIDETHSIPRSLQPRISPSSYSLLGKLGFLSPCGSRRQFYGPSFSTDPTSTVVDAGNNTSSFNSDSWSTSGLAQDLSSLFNIGQHITLCLDLSEIKSASTNDIDIMYNDIRFLIECKVHDAIEARSRALQERQRRHKQQHRHCENNDTECSRGDISEQVNLDIDDEDACSEYVSTESDDSFIDEIIGNDLELDQQDMHTEVVASLTTVLQTALNLAASENDCRIPVFGIWGDYKGDSGFESNFIQRNGNDAPSLISSILERNLLQLDNCSFVTTDKRKEDHAQMTLLSSPVLSGKCLSKTYQSSHQLYYLPRQVLPVHLSTLNGLASVFISQCPSVGNSIVLAAARHSYHWAQQNTSDERKDAWTSKGNAKWRHFRVTPTDDASSSSEVELYREQCRKQAFTILERSCSPSATRPVPIWGPNDGSLLKSLSAVVSWGVIQHDDNSFNAPPLLQLPLKIRSSNFASTPAQLLDLELALQSAALNPIGIGITEKGDGHQEFGHREPTFLASAEFDMDAPCATLSANTRCVLAALLRCGSLAQDVLPGHLTKRDVVANFGKVESMAGERTNDGKVLSNTETILHKAMDLSNVGSVTKRLVDALDWGDLEMNLSAADFDRAISEALQRINSTTYPSPPAGVFALDDVSNRIHFLAEKSQPRGKGSPPGRLLSILFAHMARLRTPTSMMRLWLSFVEELRTRWDHNESLPNLSFVPGLDNYDNSLFDKPHWGLQKVDTRVLGHRADYAAFVNSSEPDPDRDHCIINQKLQIYNICIECKMSTEALHEKISATDRNRINDSMNSDGSTSGVEYDEFFDPDEEGVSFEKSFDSNEESNIERLLMIQAAVTNPIHNRPGARCPVPDGMPLINSGDQLYAPYLQRTMPMTDEEEENQKKFLGVSKGTRNRDRPSITSRLEIAQRLQKPKLLSDMSSFKAANHGALFEDFVRWYGNPANPLSEEINGETARRALEYRSKLPPEEAKVLALEEASEAIAILMSLRAFWEDTWEEAEPLPAFEQEPLFNPYSTVEMVLHSFETIHPALLVNQVMAVKLSNVKFVLESAAIPARNIRSVAQSLVKLQTSIDDALEMLTIDATSGFLQLVPKSLTEDSGPLAFVSTSTIMKCEAACNAIGVLELQLSRALPLLQMLPGEYSLVDTLLQCEEGRYRILRHASERTAFLRAIKRSQTNSLDPPSETVPAMREYVLRNHDLSNPCQLCARLVPSFEGDQSASLFNGSLLMALTKSSRS